MTELPSVVVVGGGVTGLATARFLAGRARVTLLESSSRLGGKVAGDDVGGVHVDTGPDCFLGRVPEAAGLCRDLGLSEELVEPATTTAYLWSRNGLRRFPARSVLGLPTGVAPLLRSGAVSPSGALRAGLDLVLPRRRPGPGPGTDRSIADVVGARLGREVVERLADPVLGGIHAGRSDRLSTAANAPVLHRAATRRSLMRGLAEEQAAMAGPGPPPPLFLSLRGGMERLTERLVEDLRTAPTRPSLRTEEPVLSLRPGASARWVAVTGRDRLEADAVVVTVPAFAAAPMLAPLSATAASELRAIRHASVATVTLAYPPPAVPSHPGSGFLVPRVDGRLLTACTWLGNKWAHWDRGPWVLLRASVGRDGDTRALNLDDRALVDSVHGELVQAMGLSAGPGHATVTRWIDAFPQYDVGHLERVARIRASLPPTVAVAGAPYDGVGIAACVRQAGEAAARILESLGTSTARP